MQDEQQFEQLIMQYIQLKNGAEEIRKVIESENFDDAITMIHSREEIFLNCKCMRRYLELTPPQEEVLNKILDELRALELENINLLNKKMSEVKAELKRSQQTEKIQQAYDFNENQNGNIINVQE